MAISKMAPASTEGERTARLTREIAEHAQRKQLSAALAVYERLRAEGLSPTVYTCCAVVNAYGSSGDMCGALGAAESMMAAGLEANAAVLTALVKGYVNTGETTRAVALLDDMTSASGEHARRGRAPVRPDVRAINTALRGCVRTGHVRLARRLYARLGSEWSLEPDATTYRLMCKLLAMHLDARALRRLAQRITPPPPPSHGQPGAAAAAKRPLGDTRGGDEAQAPAETPVCLFWLEGANTCPRGSRCRFGHPAHVLQTGGGGGARGRGGRAADDGERAGGVGVAADEEALAAASASAEELRDTLLCELALAEAHAHALLGRFAEGLAAVREAELRHARLATAARERERGGGASGGEAETSWYEQLAVQELKRELNRIGTFVRSESARAERRAVEAADEPREARPAGRAAPRAGLAPAVLAQLSRTFLFDFDSADGAEAAEPSAAAVAAAGDGVAEATALVEPAPAGPSALARAARTQCGLRGSAAGGRGARAAAVAGDGVGDRVAQGLLASLLRAFGLRRACRAHASAGATPGLAHDSSPLRAGRKRARGDAAATPPSRGAHARPRAATPATARGGAPLSLTNFSAAYAHRIGRASGTLRTRHLFDADGAEASAPLHVEVCSGNGDWVVAQADATRGAVRWLAVELRCDRAWAICSRALTRRLPNLAVAAGDALRVLERHVPRGRVARLFVNFPEPPHHSGDASAESAVELLSARFFAAAHAALAPPAKAGAAAAAGAGAGAAGRLTILTDSRAYARTLARTIGASRLFAPAARVSDSAIAEQICGVAVRHGAPGPAEGHAVRAQSYFDRFWEHGQHVERFYIEVARC